MIKNKIKETFDVLTFGSITLDLMIQIPEDSPVNTIERDHNNFLEIPLGDKIKFNNSETLCGGGAANSGVGFAKMNLNTALFGVLGDQSNRGFIISELKRQGVNTDYITFAKDKTSSFSVILNAPNGERTVFHHRTLSENFNYHTLLSAPKTRAIYVGHLYDGADQLLAHIPEWKKKFPESLVGWNPGKTQFKKGLKYFKKMLPSIDVLILNVEEAEQFTGIIAKKVNVADVDFTSTFGKNISRKNMISPTMLRDLRKISQEFLDTGIKKIIITDARRGAQFFSHDEHFNIPSTDVKKVDTLGAGDSFSVGVLSAMLYKKDPATQTVWGAKNATSVIQHMGAQKGQLRLDQIDQ